MRSACGILFVLAGCISFPVDASDGGDPTIAKVQKLLQNMLTKSKADGEKDTKLNAKFTCFCD